MSAAALIPLLAMVGGAIDASRLYMARTRLQQACDAGALAGRKAMASIQTLTEAEKDKAKEFFDFNFPTATYSAQNITRAYTKGGDGVVVGDASIDMPTTIMRFFGFTTVNMAVTCQSTLNIPNTDVMFVLDVTGSMLETPTGDTVTKIDGLKQAVKDFYGALGPGVASGPGRIRYGFVPYSSNVNVGKIVYGFNPAYIVGGTGSENWHYRSRVEETTPENYISAYGATDSAHMNAAPTYTGTYGTWSNTNAAVGNYPASYSSLTSTECNGKPSPATTYPTDFGTPQNTGNDEQVQYPDTEQTRYWTATTTGTVTDYQYARTSTNTRGTCYLQKRTAQNANGTRNSTTTRSVTWSVRQKFVRWVYQDRSIDVSSIVQSGSGANPAYYTGYWSGTDPNGTSTPTTLGWNGCIEEASTDNTITATNSLNIPDGANDLKIDLKPGDTATRWKPFLPAFQYDASGNWLNRESWINAGRSVCPREASRLTMYTSDYVASTKSSANFNLYVDSLTAVGGTYHDIGMIWGARFLSPEGIFETDNRDTASPGGYQVSRHIVFMTDGTLDTKPITNDPWGITNLEGRIAATNTDETGLEAIHRRRTSMICNAMKGKGFTIWVVGFGISTMPQELQDCATDANHWSLASNSTVLRSRFQAIAQTIGGLRLSQ